MDYMIGLDELEQLKKLFKRKKQKERKILTVYDLYEWARERDMTNVPIKFYNEREEEWINADSCESYESYEYDEKKDEDMPTWFIGLR